MTKLYIVKGFEGEYLTAMKTLREARVKADEEGRLAQVVRVKFRANPENYETLFTGQRYPKAWGATVVYVSRTKPRTPEEVAQEVSERKMLGANPRFCALAKEHQRLSAQLAKGKSKHFGEQREAVLALDGVIDEMKYIRRTS